MQQRVAEMRIEYVRLGDLTRWPRNAKEHDLGALSQSVTRFGYVQPILFDEGTQRMVAGHGRLDLLAYLKSNGSPPPRRIVVDTDGEWKVPVIRGVDFGSEAEAAAYLIADNRMVELGGWNDAELYDALVAQGGALDGVGFDNDDIEELRKRLQSAADDTEVDDDTAATFDAFSKDAVAAAAFDYFRSTGFPYRNLPLHVQMQEINKLAACDQEKAFTSHYGGQVADTYHQHRYACHAVNKRSPLDSFGDDAQLRHAISEALDQGVTLGEGYFGMLGLVRGTQACSNFRPGLAMHVYRRFGVSGGLVVDPCTGYGGRLTGWIASRLGGRYVGVDPHTETHDANVRLADALAPPESVVLINSPFEDVDLSAAGVADGTADFVFTSPPYFMKERYSDQVTQSFRRYPGIDAWTDGFLRPLMRKSFAALRPGKFYCINIADIKVQQRTFPLEELTRVSASDAGFELVETIQIPFVQHFGKGVGASSDEDGQQTEPLFVFRKPDASPPPQVTRRARR